MSSFLIEIMPMDPGIGIKWVMSFGVSSNFPHFSLLSKIKLILHIISIFRVNNIERIAIISSNNIIPSLSNLKLIFQYFSLKQLM